VEKSNACRVLVGKPEGKRPLARPRHSCEDNIKRSLKDKDVMNWMWGSSARGIERIIKKNVPTKALGYINVILLHLYIEVFWAHV